MNSFQPVDDVIVISSAEAGQDDLFSGLKRAFDRACELATRHNLVGPLRLTLSDADDRCLANDDNELRRIHVDRANRTGRPRCARRNRISLAFGGEGWVGKAVEDSS